MASGSDFPDPASFFERLFSSRNGENLSRFLPFMLSLSNQQNSSNPDENSNNPDEIVRERLVFINPFTQTVFVIESSSNRDRDRDGSDDSGFESWLNDLFFRKEGQPPASKASVDAMPEVEIGEKGLECVICLEELEVGEKGKEMPCKHRFHGGCIEKWLKIHGTCPVCRYKMPVDERSEKSEENQSESGGRRREAWMGFGFGENQSESSTESANDADDSTFFSELD